MPLRVAITGVAGRLGAAISKALKKDARVEVVAGLDVIAGKEVTQTADLAAGGFRLPGCDVVVHAAALPGPSRTTPPGVDATLGEKLEREGIIGLEDAAPVDLLVNNVSSTMRVLEAAADAGATRVVLSSSAFAMGWAHDPRAFLPETLPLTDDTPPRPHEAYGLSKALGDEIGASYARSSGLEVCSLRFTNVVKRELFDRMPWAYSDDIPLLQWAWCHEDDVVDAHAIAATAPAAQLFDGAEPRYTSLLVAAASTRFAQSTTELLAERFGARAPAFRGAGNDSILDASRARRALRPWRPRCWRSSTRGFASAAAVAARADPAVEYLDIGGFELDSGATLPQHARLAYRIFSDGEGPLVLQPTSFGAVHTELEADAGMLDEAFGEDATVVAVNMLGNGVSFSPGDGGYPDLVSIDDNARLQKKLVDDVFDGRQLSLAYGYSMGGMQALAFARLFPEAAARVMCVCGAAGCEAYNAVFLEALLAVLAGGGTREETLRAFGTVYAGWGVGYQFYRDEVWRDGGFESLEDFVERSYVGGFARDDPDDLRAMVRTWRAAPPAPPGLENITARVLLAPCDTDAYFRVPEVAELAQRIPGAVVRPMASPHGHRAGDPQRPGMESEREWLRGAVSRFREGG